MIVVQIFIGFCFGVTVAFFFGLGCHAITQSLRISSLQVQGLPTESKEKMLGLFIVGLAGFTISGVLAIIATYAVRLAA